MLVLNESLIGLSHLAMNTQINSETGASNVARVWVVTAPSAYRMGHTCFLGRGATKSAAITDAFGPKPWGNATRASMRIADIYELDASEADALEFQGDN